MNVAVTSASNRAPLRELEQLLSEERNQRTLGIDLMSSAEIAAVINATCSGVARTSFWPMADWASPGASRSSGKPLPRA